MCRRGHSDKWIRYRQNGYRYCRRCATLAKYKRKHGLPGLDPLPSQIRLLDRERFKRVCTRWAIGTVRAVGLAGRSHDCLGAYYSRGAGPEVRRDICEYLRVSESEIWK